MDSRDQDFASVVSLLQGTKANFGLCWVSMVGSVAVGAVGMAVITDEPGAGILANRRALACQSLLFLITQSFTLAKVSRDRSMFKKDPAMALANPTVEYMIQVGVAFLISLGCAIYSLVNFSAIPEWKGFFAMVIVWVTCNALCLSKAVRDRSDAAKANTLPVEQLPAHLDELLRIAEGTTEYRLLVGFSAVSAVAMMLTQMWVWSSETLGIERKGFITVCVLWCEGSSFHFAKLVRDRLDPVKAKELQQQLAYQGLVFGSSLLSTGLLFSGICAMPLDTPKKLFLITGSMFVISTAFFLAKNVRDRLEAGSLISKVRTRRLAGGATDVPFSSDTGGRLEGGTTPPASSRSGASPAESA